MIKKLKNILAYIDRNAPLVSVFVEMLLTPIIVPIMIVRLCTRITKSNRARKRAEAYHIGRREGYRDLGTMPGHRAAPPPPPITVNDRYYLNHNNRKLLLERFGKQYLPKLKIVKKNGPLNIKACFDEGFKYLYYHDGYRIASDKKDIEYMELDSFISREKSRARGLRRGDR